MAEHFNRTSGAKTIEAEGSKASKRNKAYYQSTIGRPDSVTVGQQRREARALGLSEYSSQEEIDNARDLTRDRHVRKKLASKLDCPDADLTWDEIEAIEIQTGKPPTKEQRAERLGLRKSASDEEIATERERLANLKNEEDARINEIWKQNFEERQEQSRSSLPERIKREGLPPDASERDVMSSLYRRIAARQNHLSETASWDEVHEAIYGENWKEEYEKEIADLEAKIDRMTKHILEKYKLSKLPSYSGMHKIPGAARNGDTSLCLDIHDLLYRLRKLKNQW